MSTATTPRGRTPPAGFRPTCTSVGVTTTLRLLPGASQACRVSSPVFDKLRSNDCDNDCDCPFARAIDASLVHPPLRLLSSTAFYCRLHLRPAHRAGGDAEDGADPGRPVRGRPHHSGSVILRGAGGAARAGRQLLVRPLACRIVRGLLRVHHSYAAAVIRARCLPAAAIDAAQRSQFEPELPALPSVPVPSPRNCSYYCPNYDNMDGAAGWAAETLRTHASDKRTATYSRAQFEAGRTHEGLWNAAQVRARSSGGRARSRPRRDGSWHRVVAMHPSPSLFSLLSTLGLQMELVHRGKLAGFMRMYWAKKILEWSATPEEALATAIYLNDKYSLDGRDPNGYVGCMWAICGTHDMGWAERAVFGKIRYM